MTTSETTMRRTSALLPGAHRVVRRLGAGEGPFPGVLVADGESMAVLRDAEGLAGWGGWSLAGARHVAAPLDVVRRVDGHDVLLPWCTEKVAVFLGRRARAESALSSGEVTTLAVSLLRGIGELGVDPTEVRTGEWWLTDRGRPVLVIGEGVDARVAAAALLDAIASESADRVQRRVLAAVAEGLCRDPERSGVPQRQIDAWESELLAVAAPRPLVSADEATEGATPRHVAQEIRALRPGSASRPERRAVTRAEDRGGDRRRRVARASMRGGIVAFARAATARSAVAMGRLSGLVRTDAVIVTERTKRQRGRSANRRRVPKLAVGLATAGVVLAAGLLWPGDSGGQASEAPSGSEGVEEGAIDSDPSHPPTDPPMQTPPGDPDEASRDSNGHDDPLHQEPGDGPVSPIEREAARLVSDIRDCAAAGDQECGTAVVAGAGHVVTLFQSASDAAEPSAGVESVSLVDDYGGAAVVRLSTRGGHLDGRDSGVGSAGAVRYDRMLVLVRLDEKWLVRDAYDVADQPG